MSKVELLAAGRPLSEKAEGLLNFFELSIPVPPFHSCIVKRGQFGLALGWKLEKKLFFHALPASDWVLFYLNRPALRLPGLDFPSVLLRLPHAHERRDHVVKVRLHDLDEARAMSALIARATGSDR